MIPIKATSLDDIIARAKADQAIYDKLLPEERAEVDAFNAKISGKPIQEIIAAGVHPFVKYRDKYGK